MNYKLKVSIWTIAVMGAAFPVFANQPVDAKHQEGGYSEHTSLKTQRGTYAGNDVVGDVRADNTALNVRDRDQNTLTPLDQGTSPADINATAAIRKEIMESKDMSVDAQNVKIITRDGKVTLRGPVKTVEEKVAVYEIARRVAQPQNVDDQLEVAGDPQRV